MSRKRWTMTYWHIMTTPDPLVVSHLTLKHCACLQLISPSRHLISGIQAFRPFLTLLSGTNPRLRCSIAWQKSQDGSLPTHETRRAPRVDLNPKCPNPRDAPRFHNRHTRGPLAQFR
jgi:hypothetical protein